MESLRLLLIQVKILRNGADGGHLYLSGRSDFNGLHDIPTFAFFKDKKDEREFESRFDGQALSLHSDRWDYVQGAGLNLHDIEWEVKDSDEE